MDDINNSKSSIILLDERKFKNALAGDNQSKLINEHNAPIENLIHPLSYSLDLKKHADMQAIPIGYKFNRNFKKLYDELRKTP